MCFANMTPCRHLAAGLAPQWATGSTDSHTPPTDPNTFATFAKAAAYTSIKSVQSTLTVISAGLSPAVDNGSDIAPVTFVKGIYSGGANKYLDALAMHPYTYPALPPDPTAVTETFQAQTISVVLQTARDTAWLGPAFLYNIRDSGTNLADREQNFGILKRDFTPKAGYAALQAIATAAQ
ncbi:hypothetical protein BH09ACT8_BH09ACT8_07660 [soil metagenome]